MLDVKKLLTPTTLAFVVAAIVGGGFVGVFAGRRLAEPEMRLAKLRYNAHGSLLKLVDLQKAFKKSHGRFASDLSVLLASTPDGAAVRAKLEEHVDLNTLVVKGDAKTYKLEGNVLDPERSLIKLKGP